ncbi:MAG: glutamine--fructose-6-phosphate transaminase (isomerizing) [Anaerolineaceae bacterium]|nr:glutamine--fructose-6-phosphate transaminase (isomerizing) [Anaerolineaceae bacterium]
MCGIVGYLGERDATPVIVNGLKKLEYRGYDSAGVAVLQKGNIEVRREAGKIAGLETLIARDPLHGKIGIGHTRWATHGIPSQQNAHPQVGSTGRIVIVHNGIVENFLALKEELCAEGVAFKSETDTETIVHLIEHFYALSNDLYAAVSETLKRIRGAHGIVVLSADHPEQLIAARLGNAGGIAIGLAENESFIASDLPAIVEFTHRIIFLESGQVAVVKRDSVSINTLNGKPIKPVIQNVPWDPISAEKGQFRHFMQKEIHEQVRSLSDTMVGRVDFDSYRITLPDLHCDAERAKSIEKIIITACGTAAYAGMVGKVILEKLTRIPTEVMIASEFRYADPIVDENTIVLAISQSGETADTLAAMDEGRKRKATIWSIVNAIGSQAMRVADGFISMQAGPEIGVASTKAFTAPIMNLYMLAVYLADLRGSLSKTRRIELVRDMLRIPSLAEKTLAREEEVVAVAEQYKNSCSALYLGRGANMPIAYEGALKLKEITYIHAEGYPAGEMKHGPIALVDKDLPVVALATQDAWYEKMVSQIEQAKARNGKVIAVATEGDELIPALADAIFWTPKTPWLLSPVINVIPLQLFAYHIAVLRGLDVDQPRNLAKSVTVE